MSEPEDKDKIKEILEGHNKKFTTAELIVGIVVILIIGCGIGYAVFKLLTPSVTIPPKTITEVQQPQTPPITEEKGNVTQQSAQINKQVPKTSEENATQSSQVIALGNNTKTKMSNMQQTGPKIIPPKPIMKSKAAPVKMKEIKRPKLPKPKQVTVKKKSITHLAAVHAVRKVKRRIRHKRFVSGKYVLQVSSNKNRKFALLTVIKLRKCGHNAYTKEVEIKGEKFTRVYVGPIRGYIVAKAEAKEIKKQLHLGYLPMIIRDD